MSDKKEPPRVLEAEELHRVLGAVIEETRIAEEVRERTGANTKSRNWHRKSISLTLQQLQISGYQGIPVSVEHGDGRTYQQLWTVELVPQRVVPKRSKEEVVQRIGDTLVTYGIPHDDAARLAPALEDALFARSALRHVLKVHRAEPRNLQNFRG